MNYRMIGFAIGRILLVEAALLLLPMAVALGYGESPVPYLLPAALLVLCGGLLSFKKPRQASLFARDGLAVVALAWIAVSLFGALPFYISGSIESFVDCFFETVSGFTTTGATILTEVESLNRGILFWRSFTHWVGGMGVLVFVMAILPMGGGWPRDAHAAGGDAWTRGGKAGEPHERHRQNPLRHLPGDDCH